MNDWGQTITIIVSIVVGVGGIVIYVNRQTNKRIDDFRNDVNRRFEAVDKRFEAIDKRFEAVDRRFEEIRADIRLILNKLIPERKSKDSD